MTIWADYQILETETDCILYDYRKWLHQADDNQDVETGTDCILNDYRKWLFIMTTENDCI